MCPGVNRDVQSVDDIRKTGVIDNELRRLKIDIATLQETRLPDAGSLREQNYTFFWQGKNSMSLDFIAWVLQLRTHCCRRLSRRQADPRGF